MALFSVSDEWVIELGDDFEQHVEDGSLVFSNGDRAVWIDLFEDDRTREEKLALLQEDMPTGAKKWEFEQENLLKFGYLERDEENENYELTTFSISTTEYALITFYFDEEESLDWALKRWRSMSFENEE
jgi:Mg2+ and Co2+ transporter CorA